MLFHLECAPKGPEKLDSKGKNCEVANGVVLVYDISFCLLYCFHIDVEVNLSVCIEAIGVLDFLNSFEASDLVCEFFGRSNCEKRVV